MQLSLLRRMETIISNKIAAKKEMSEKYSFQEIKRKVLQSHIGDLGNERDRYSSELSRRFAKAGRQIKHDSLKKPGKKELALFSKELASIREMQLYAEAAAWEIEEAIRTQHASRTADGDILIME